MLFSSSKSFTSTAVGLAVTEGEFSLDDAVLSFFPDDAPAEPSDIWRRWKCAHLLSMSTGQDAEAMPDMTAQSDGRLDERFLCMPVLHAAGHPLPLQHGATYMLSAIVQKATGMKVLDYLQPRLFEPLGIENPTWEKSPQGISIGGFGLSIRTEDIADSGSFICKKACGRASNLCPRSLGRRGHRPADFQRQ